ncbi:MAG: insulinase family protein, partial [Alphaproteobacteria bacterium]|nr:insulinase family protein [Alphaproteobacteria bacterium]
LADILTHPTFDQTELERERQVVLQEIGQARDTPDDVIFDHLQATIYPHQPMGWPILGEDDTVAGFSRGDLQSYMAGNYRAGSMVVVASGAVDHEMVVRLCEEKFSSLPPGTTPTPATAQWIGGESRVADDLEQAHMTFAFPGLCHTDPDIYALQVYTMALGGGMSSRLFQEVREKRGLCYTISAMAQSATDGGVVAIYTGTGEQEAREIAPVVAGEMAALASQPGEAEITRARAQLKSALLMGLERPANRAEQLASQLLTHGRIVDVGEQIAKLGEVDAAAIRRVGERLMATERPAMASLGPVGKLESFGTFAARFGGTVAMRAAE